MAGDALRFIRKNGRVIPIRAAKGVGHAAKAAKAVKHVARGAVVGAGTVAIAKHGSVKSAHEGVQVHQGMNALGIATSVASGALGALTFSSGMKGFLAGAAIGHGIDAAGVAANVASVAGRGHLKERAIQAGKQEARNFAIGNAVFAAGILGSARNRATAVGMVKAVPAFAAKVLAFSRKALRVI